MAVTESSIENGMLMDQEEMKGHLQEFHGRPVALRPQGTADVRFVEKCMITDMPVSEFMMHCAMKRTPVGTLSLSSVTEHL